MARVAAQYAYMVSSKARDNQVQLWLEWPPSMLTWSRVISSHRKPVTRWVRTLQLIRDLYSTDPWRPPPGPAGTFPPRCPLHSSPLRYISPPHLFARRSSRQLCLDRLEAFSHSHTHSTQRDSTAVPSWPRRKVYL